MTCAATTDYFGFEGLSCEKKRGHLDHHFCIAETVDGHPQVYTWANVPKSTPGFRKFRRRK